MTRSFRASSEAGCPPVGRPPGPLIRTAPGWPKAIAKRRQDVRAACGPGQVTFGTGVVHGGPGRLGWWLLGRGARCSHCGLGGGVRAGGASGLRLRSGAALLAAAEGMGAGAGQAAGAEVGLAALGVTGAVAGPAVGDLGRAGDRIGPARRSGGSPASGRPGPGQPSSSSRRRARWPGGRPPARRRGPGRSPRWRSRAASCAARPAGCGTTPASRRRPARATSG